MSRFIKHLLFDLLFWFCIYCMYTKNQYVGSAEVVVYLIVGLKVFLSSLAVIGLALIKGDTAVKEAAIKYKPTGLLHRMYARVSTVLEIAVLAVSGYLVCTFLYMLCFFATLHLHNKFMEYKK